MSMKMLNKAQGRAFQMRFEIANIFKYIPHM